ncbi:cyclic nucleotide-gated channel beta-1 isoform X2 [Halyomorpha halys]
MLDFSGYVLFAHAAPAFTVIFWCLVLGYLFNEEPPPKLFISFTIMILWGAVLLPTGMTNQRERILFNHTSSAFSLTSGGIIFDKIMGNETPYKLQLVYSIFGFLLYGTILIIQLFNHHNFDESKIALMITMHVIAVFIFLITAISIYATRMKDAGGMRNAEPGPSGHKGSDEFSFSASDNEIPDIELGEEDIKFKVDYEDGTPHDNIPNEKRASHVPSPEQDTQPVVNENGKEQTPETAAESSKVEGGEKKTPESAIEQTERVREQTSPENAQEQTSPGNAQEQTSPGNAQEKTSPGNVKEQTSPENAQEQTSPENVQEHTSPGNAQEQTSPGNVQEQTSPGNVQEQTSPENAQEPGAPESSEKQAAPEKVIPESSIEPTRT